VVSAFSAAATGNGILALDLPGMGPDLALAIRAGD
jgi:hypothetical protein